MIAPKDSASAPLVVIVGITGQQGGSLAQALMESKKPYRIVGLTRDTTRPRAAEWSKQGVEMRQVQLSLGHEAEAVKAFEDADVVFAVTNFEEHGDGARETAEGKMMVDAAKIAKVKLFLWSNLVAISKSTNGRLSRCVFFDSKAAVAAYLSTSGVPHAIVSCGLYASNFLGPKGYVFAKQGDGSYVAALPCQAETKVPIIDVAKDYGLYVRAAIENPNFGVGSEVLSGCLTSLADIVAQTSEFTGKKIVYKQVTPDEYVTMLEPFAGPVAAMVADMFSWFGEAGYYGSKDLEANQAIAGIKPRPFSEILRIQKPPLLN